MSKKLKGFSLAELLVSLLVISIVLSAAIPTITKKTAREREQIWNWSTSNNSTFFGIGSNQAVLIGTPDVPMNTDSPNSQYTFSDIMEDDSGETEDTYYHNPRFATSGDKLIILKRSLQGETTNMANSHISFYNLQNGIGSPESDITYGGRIAADKHNLAFGRATLLHMNNISDTFFGENTAIGHYALMASTSGYQNVAIGEKTLSHTLDGNSNTALGYLAGNTLGSNERENRSAANLTFYEKISDSSALPTDAYLETETASRNTTIGSAAMYQNRNGFGNTAIGAQSLNSQLDGHGNTVVGYHALGTLNRGYSNTAIGTNACSDLNEGNYNICIGNASYSTTKQYKDSMKPLDNFGLFIGTSTPLLSGQTTKSFSTETNYQRSAPLISGHTQRVGNIKNPKLADNKDGNYDKELIVNSRNVIFKPYFGGDLETFKFVSSPGDIHSSTNDGYYDTSGQNTGVSSIAYFNLRHMNNASNTDSVTMSFSAKANNAKTNESEAVIGAYNPNTVASGSATLANLSFNDILIFDMPNKDGQIDTGVPESILNITEGRIGILAPDHDIIINDSLNVSGNSSHVVDLDNVSLKVWNANNVKTKPDFEIKNNDIYLRATSSIKFNINDYDESVLEIYQSGLTVPAEKDIHLTGLTIGGGDGVRTILKHLNDQITSGYQQSSDARLKNISGDNTAGLAEINKIEVKNYTYKNDKKKIPHVGVIAQQLQKVFPNSVSKGEDGYFKIRTEEIFYAMVNSIKELCAKIQDLTAKVVGLDKRISELEAQNKLLLEQNKAFEKRLKKLEKQAEK